jgi:hypothetical protein
LSHWNAINGTYEQFVQSVVRLVKCRTDQAERWPYSTVEM